MVEFAVGPGVTTSTPVVVVSCDGGGLAVPLLEFPAV
jgi:hypothetical protein